MQRPDDKKANKDWNWATYFAAKKQKLQQQYQQDKSESNDADETKNLFKNIGIFVNGYTNPTAIELKALMVKHGGLFFEYMNERVTYIVASNLAHSKALALKNRIVIRPEWITDCIKEKKLLTIDSYLLITSANDKAQNKLTDYMSNKDKTDDDCIQPKERPLKRKSVDPVFIDLSKSPTRQSESNKSSKKSEYLADYLLFKNKIKKFEQTNNETRQIKSYNKNESEIDSVKALLNDWITFTSKNSNSYFNRNNQQKIDTDDLQIFENYLLYLLNVKKDFEKLKIIIKIFKRLILINGSFEWTETYKEICSSIQSDFFQNYDSTLHLD